MDEMLEQLQTLIKASRGALRDGVPVDVLNEELAARTGGAANSFQELNKLFRARSDELDRKPTGAASAFLQNVGQSATFGFSDELAGVVGGARSALRGEGFRPGFERTTDVAREGLRNASQDQPAASIAGGILGLAGPGAPLRAARGAARVGIGGLEGLAFGLGSGEGSIGERAGGGALAGGLGLATGGLLNAAARAGRLGRALLPRNRPAREPFSSGQRASDEFIEAAARLGRPFGPDASKKAQAAFTRGKSLVSRPPSDIADAIRRAGGLGSRVKDGVAEGLGRKLAQGNPDPRAIIQRLNDPANVDRMRLLFDSDKAFDAWMAPIIRAAKLQTDAAIGQAIGEIGRNVAVFGLGAGFSSLLARGLR